MKNLFDDEIIEDDVPGEEPGAADVDQKKSAELARSIQKDQEKNSHKRRSARHPTFAVGTMTILNTSQDVEGVVTEISDSGLTFKPASLFLLEQNGERVKVSLGGMQASGTIRASRADGYGIQLFKSFDEGDLEFILATFTVE